MAELVTADGVHATPPSIRLEMSVASDDSDRQVHGTKRRHSDSQLDHFDAERRARPCLGHGSPGAMMPSSMPTSVAVPGTATSDTPVPSTDLTSVGHNNNAHAESSPPLGDPEPFVEGGIGGQQLFMRGRVMSATSHQGVQTRPLRCPPLARTSTDHSNIGGPLETLVFRPLAVRDHVTRWVEAAATGEAYRHEDLGPEAEAVSTGAPVSWASEEDEVTSAKGLRETRSPKAKVVPVTALRYRDVTLRQYGIRLAAEDEILPDYISALVASLSTDHLETEEKRHRTFGHFRTKAPNTAESTSFFSQFVFEDHQSEAFSRSTSAFFRPDALPAQSRQFPLAKSQTTVCYGYGEAPFTPRQLSQLSAHTSTVFSHHISYFPLLAANVYPCTGGVATRPALNRCMNTSLICFTAMERFRFMAKMCGVSSAVPDIVFFVSLNAKEAAIFATYATDEPGCRYVTAKVAGFRLLDDKDLVRLRSLIHGILDWGATTRLDDLRAILDALHAKFLDSF